ncbi:MAG: 3-phosphoshikimate 1-carboxyvinyltransferase [Polyangiaceae bacterium]|nr:3-phosphoshikimate 1-carboxyvinyltransferase [Polyangiaceae bacterium]
MNYPAGPFSIPPLPSSRGASLFRWTVPGSKSITTRALLLAALADGTTTLRGVLQSDDTRHMRNALEAMGILIEDVDATTLRVKGGRARLHAPSSEIFVGNSGTTVRFLSAFCALVPGKVTLVGDEHMAKRPIGDLVDGLGQLGVSVECPTSCPPLTISGGRLPGGDVTMPGNKSSQYFSALLMAASGAEKEIFLKPEGELVSRPYIDITLNMMAAFGAKFKEQDGGFLVQPSQLKACDYQIEPDASSASYAFAAGAITGVPVEVPGLTEGALQGDYAFVDLLAQAGAKVEKLANSTKISSARDLNALDVDMHHISDTVMTLAAIAPLMKGQTKISNVYNIRIKETDRLEATVNELKRLGQAVESGRDWLSITPAPLQPTTVLSYSDHRMAMAFALLGLVATGVAIEDPACVAKTYPGFWNDLKSFYEHCGASLNF